MKEGRTKNRLLAAWRLPEVTDPVVRREVRLLFGVARPQAVIFLALAPIFLVPGVTSEAAGAASAAVMVLGALPLLAALPLVHRGHLGKASWLVVGGSTLTYMAATTLFGGVESVVTGSLVLGVLIAGVLRGWRSAAAVAVASIAYVAAEAALEAHGLAPVVLPRMVRGAAIVTAVGLLAIAAALLWLYARELALSAEAARASDARALASEQALADLVRQSPDGIAVVGRDGAMRSVNRALLDMTGYAESDFLGRSVLALPLIPDAEALAVVRDGFLRTIAGERVTMRVPLRRADGSPLWVETVGRLLDRPGAAGDFQVMIRDVSASVEAERARLRLEAELRDARRLEGIGRLAGGVAHDFRNLLTPVLVNAELLACGAPPPAEARLLAAEIAGAAQRASDLTGQLLTFARRQLHDVRTLDPNQVLRDLVPLLRRLVREDIRLEVRLGGEVGAVLADRTQLEQVVVNLVANARDAMPRGGQLTITTAALVLDEAAAAARRVRPGPHVELTVRDTGEGMTEEVRRQIFEPFFTTKEGGRGTGLGLATVYGVVTQGGGQVDVESAPGRGATFRVLLPVSHEPLAGPAPARPAAALPARATVLVVDDEPLVRGVVARALRARGLEVLLASDGAAALGLLAGLGERLDLLITDVVMPGLDGPGLAEAVRRSHPGVRVLFVSGYADHGPAAGGRLGPGVPFLPKPFTPDALAAKVAEVLAAPA